MGLSLHKVPVLRELDFGGFGQAEPQHTPGTHSHQFLAGLRHSYGGRTDIQANDVH